MKRKFKIPRKLKKKLGKGIWLYNPVDGGSLMAHPSNNEKDFLAWKNGELRDLTTPDKKRREEFSVKINPEIYVSDEELLNMVNEIFAEKYRYNSLDALKKIKNIDKNIYFNFVNSYNLYKEGDESFSNICCMAVDSAIDILKK